MPRLSLPVKNTKIIVDARPGDRFVLSDHPDPEVALDGADRRGYLVTDVEHFLEQSGVALPGAAPVGAPAPDARGYWNRFTAIPFRTPFRPARTTPRPQVAGVINARVADPDANPAPHLDAAGSYRLVLPFDTVGGGGSTTLRTFRMAQPFAGAGYGMHFPLHKGTEVLLVHLGGDPDEPVIAAAIPNADTPSPMTSANPTHGGYRTRSGIVDVYNDEA